MFIYLAIIDSASDKSKFEQIYIKYKNLMYVTAYKLVKNHHDAEDCVHNAFLSIIQNLNKVQEVNSLQTASLVMLITERKAVDLYRKKQRINTVELNEQLAGFDIPMPGDNGLADAISKLPAHYRSVLLLRFDNGYSCKEIAKMLGITESGVRQNIRRARKALEERLGEEVDSE